MERGLTKMARQTTLFGTAAKKDKFFKELDSPGEDDDGYYAVIEALWTVVGTVHVSSIFYSVKSRGVGGGSWLLCKIHGLKKLSIFTDGPLLLPCARRGHFRRLKIVLVYRGCWFIKCWRGEGRLLLLYLFYFIYFLLRPQLSIMTCKQRCITPGMNRGRGDGV